MTDGIPADLPSLAGVLSLSAATPNSHPVILARARLAPFAYLTDPASRSHARQLINKEIVYQAGDSSVFGIRPVILVEVEVRLDSETRSAIEARRHQLSARITPKAKYGTYSALADILYPSDIQFFGGKAANFGFLRRVIPSNSAVAIAFSFDLWDEFMGQVLPGGRTLRAEIDRRLGASNLNECLYTEARIEYLQEFSLKTLSGQPSSWPGATQRLDTAGGQLTNSWVVGTGLEERTFSLVTTLPAQEVSSLTPFIGQEDLRKAFTVTYQTPVMFPHSVGANIWSNSSAHQETVYLYPCPAFVAMTNDRPLILSAQSASHNPAVTFEITFYAPLQRPGDSDLITAPVPPLAETRISRLISQPILLRSYYAQTARPGMHNMHTEYVFEPGLEAETPGSVMEELRAGDIKLVYLIHHPSLNRCTLAVQGWNGQFRSWSW